jgi:hypothetical protein
MGKLIGAKNGLVLDERWLCYVPGPTPSMPGRTGMTLFTVMMP